MIFNTEQVFSILFHGHVLIDYTARHPSGMVAFHSPDDLKTPNGFIIPMNLTSYSAQSLYFRFQMLNWLRQCIDAVKEKYKKRPWVKTLIPLLEAEYDDFLYLCKGTSFNELIITSSGGVYRIKLDIEEDGPKYTIMKKSIYIGDVSDLRMICTTRMGDVENPPILEMAVATADNRDDLLNDLKKHNLFKTSQWVNSHRLIRSITYDGNALIDRIFQTYVRFYHRWLQEAIEVKGGVPEKCIEEIKDIFLSTDSIKPMSYL